MAFAEESWVLVGEVTGGVWLGRLIGHRTGETASVDVAWRATLRREERYGDVVGFLHTHPPKPVSAGPPAPSARDVRTMAAWCSCFGKPLLCAIAAGEALAGFVFAGGHGGYVRADRIVRLGRQSRPAIVAVHDVDALTDQEVTDAG